MLSDSYWPRLLLPAKADSLGGKPVNKICWMLISVGLVAALIAVPVAAAEDQIPRKLTVDDYFRLGEVDDPQISPGGAWIAYTVVTYDLEEDKSYSRIWMVPTEGGDAVPMSAEEQTSSRPRWSPGRQVSGLSFSSR